MDNPLTLHDNAFRILIKVLKIKLVFELDFAEGFFNNFYIQYSTIEVIDFCGDFPVELMCNCPRDFNFLASQFLYEFKLNFPSNLLWKI